jgi:hypothetical protein
MGSAAGSGSGAGTKMAQAGAEDRTTVGVRSKIAGEPRQAPLERVEDRALIVPLG